MRIPISREAVRFLLPLVILAVSLMVFHLWALGWLFFFLALFVLFFFRDPERRIPEDPSLLLSPADGRVVRVEEYSHPELGSRRRISIFLSVFNVHINRFPMAGRITRIQYFPGRFLAAFRPEASQQNERNTLEIQSGETLIQVTQIAGLIARRIVCWKKPGDAVARGERFGLIRFGSRVDLDLPKELEILVKIGDSLRGGRDVVARSKKAMTAPLP
jgi:phosphatidylserine decarboxylase